MKDIDYKMVDGQPLCCTVHNIFSITLLPTYIDHKWSDKTVANN